MEQVGQIIREKAREFDVEGYREFQVEGKCSYADQFIIMTGSSPLSIRSLAEKILFDCKHAGIPAISIEGLDEGEWVLLDFGDIIAHLMMADKRDYFRLESIWEKMS